jgi:RNA polymerase sigma-70 factor (ECF subfamily)
MVSPELVDACKRGDPRAFEELVESTHRQAYTLALRLVGDRQEAEDVTQEAYLRVYRALSRFRGEARFETWLYRIVANAAMNHLRRRGRFGDLAAEPDDLEVRADESPGPEQVVERDELEGALARLPEGTRAMVVLKDMYGLTCEEIGRELGVSEGAVKVRLHRARRTLKQLIYGSEEPVSNEV